MKLGSLVENLEYSKVSQLDVQVRRRRLCFNRIKHFERQISYHFTEKRYYPILAKLEVKKIRSLYDTLIDKFIINSINHQDVKKVNYIIDHWLTIKEHWKNVTGLDWIQKKYDPSLPEKVYLENLELMGRKSKKTQYLWRLNMQLDESIHKKWYIIMNTLTVAPLKKPMVWDKGSIAFKLYIQKFDRITNKENHVYFAVVERGSKGNREHIHVLHMLQDIPKEWKCDPNKALSDPYKRQIPEIFKWWIYGFSCPIAVRISQSDAWGKIGFRWPVKITNNNPHPLEVSNGGKLANYLSKYITKSLLEKGGSRWKIRQRQNLGMSIVNQTINQLNLNQLNQMIQISKMQVLQIHKKMIPPQILIKSTHRRILELLKSKNCRNLLMSLEPQSSIIKRLRILTQTKQTYKLLSSSSSVIKNTTNTVISNIQYMLDQNTFKTTGYLYPVYTHVLAGNSNYRS